MRIAGYEVHPAAELFPLLDEVGLQRLAEDIREHGQKVPIVLLDGKILDGRNRAAACKKLGIDPKTVNLGTGNPWRAVWSLNAERRQIEDKVRLALIGKRMVEGSDAWDAKQSRAKAETSRGRSDKAKAQHAVSNPRRGEKSGAASREARPDRKAAARLAAEVGVSRATMERAIELERKAPARAAQVEAGEVDGQSALRAVKRTAVVEKIAAETTAAEPLDGVSPCPIVYADPPWSYDNKASAGAVVEQYQTMPLADIKALRVPATDNAVLFMWATSPLLPEAFEVIKAWGFTYKASMVWDKGSGTGNWVLNAHELLLIAVRGDIPCPLPENRPVSVVKAPKSKHSEKPEEFAALIERMYPELPKVELFARSQREGWSVWGNQAA